MPRLTKYLIAQQKEQISARCRAICQMSQEELEAEFNKTFPGTPLHLHGCPNCGRFPPEQSPVTPAEGECRCRPAEIAAAAADHNRGRLINQLLQWEIEKALPSAWIN